MTDALHSSSSYESDKHSAPVVPSQAAPVVEDKELARLRRKERLSSAFTIALYGFSRPSYNPLDFLRPAYGSATSNSLTNVLFGQIYGKAFTSSISTRLSNSLTVGTILGQVSIGIVCDLLGRKHGIVISTFCIVAGIIIVTASHGAHGALGGFFWCFTIGRGLTGIGVGGEYPSSSASAAEAANEKMVKSRGPVFILVTNLVLSCGSIFACILYLIVFEAAGGLNANLSTVWRTVLGISMVPPLAVFIFRMRMLNSQLYRKNAIQQGVPLKLTLKYYWRSLIGTCVAWFLYDFVTFPNGVFSGTIISSIVHAKGKSLFRATAEWQLLLGTIALPGVFVGAWLVNRIGRRNTMMLGFSGYLLIGLIVGCSYTKHGLMQSFGNLGPGDVLGLVSAESFASPVRGTLYGFSAAIGTESFTPIRNNLGPRWTFIVAAICGILGVLVTYFFIRNDLGGDLAEEDRKFVAYLRSQGWDGHVGVSGKEALVDAEEGPKGDVKAKEEMVEDI
ncbi:MFS transporter, glycerophosphoinositol and glycerophosphocholine uptake [Rhodotorula toruloides]|uniref:MFS transporter, glycerophosphoinositol and glycerophosphocholine uptake n=1 Tax=Rhodotorula toruloides TaxID=5286 RepID=A0A511KPL0_RHOTO|nr:MFS transporter, glycerophosphoinositol and glycerophosphocholine uptake [Rhodotorula toruloides]